MENPQTKEQMQEVTDAVLDIIMERDTCQGCLRLTDNDDWDGECTICEPGQGYCGNE